MITWQWLVRADTGTAVALHRGTSSETACLASYLLTLSLDACGAALGDF